MSRYEIKKYIIIWSAPKTFTSHFYALEKEMATHCSFLAWNIPRKEEPGGLPNMGSQRVRHDWSDLAAAAAVNPLASSLLVILTWLLNHFLFFNSVLQRNMAFILLHLFNFYASHPLFVFSRSRYKMRCKKNR